MIISNNTSAGCLYNILELLRNNADLDPNNAFKQIFKINNSSLSAINEYYMDLLHLVYALREQSKSFGGRTAERFEKNLSIVLDAIISIDFCSPNRHNGLSAFKRKLSDGVMENLGSLADFMADNGFEKQVGKEELDEILDAIKGLINTINNSSLENGYKRNLIAHLNNLMTSVHKYNFWGVDGINESLHKTTGYILLEAPKIANDREHVQVVKAVLEKMRNFNTIFSFTKAVGLLPPIITALLDKMN